MNCKSTTKAGNPCKNKATDGSNFCRAHQGKAKKNPVPVQQKPSRDLPGWLLEGVEQRGISRPAPQSVQAPAEPLPTLPAEEEEKMGEKIINQIKWGLESLPFWMLALIGVGAAMLLYLLIRAPAALAAAGLVGLLTWLKPWKRWKIFHRAPKEGPPATPTVSLVTTPKSKNWLQKNWIWITAAIVLGLVLAAGLIYIPNPLNMRMGDNRPTATSTPLPTNVVPVLTPDPTTTPEGNPWGAPVESQSPTTPPANPWGQPVTP